MDGPLDGIRVLEVANWLAAPAAAALLADMGAEVVKIEPPQGDAWRGYTLVRAGFPSVPGDYPFQTDNRGKRSVTVNLETPEGQAVVHRLAAQADIFITNFIPGRIERYDLSYEKLSASNPRLIYAQFSGYGTKGAERDRLGFDYAGFWARSGIMSLIGEEGRAPALQRGGMGDHTTSLAIVSGVLAALYERERSGRGQRIDFSLLNTGLWVLATDLSGALVTRSHPTIHNRTTPPNPIWNTYRCGDGRWLMLVMPQPDPYWPRVCAALGLDALVDDPRFNSLNARAEHNRQLVAILEETFERLTIAEAGERLDGHGVIWAPVQQLTEVVDDPQARVNGYFATVEHPTLGRFEMVDAPFRFQRSHVGVRGPAPEVGQHTEEVLIEQGYTWEEIVELRERGAL